MFSLFSIICAFIHFQKLTYFSQKSFATFKKKVLIEFSLLPFSNFLQDGRGPCRVPLSPLRAPEIEFPQTKKNHVHTCFWTFLFSRVRYRVYPFFFVFFILHCLSSCFSFVFFHVESVVYSFIHYVFQISSPPPLKIHSVF